jgi:hypothetical protein
LRERGRLGGLALLLLCLVGCGPSEESGSAEAFCQALRALRAGEIEVGSDDPNEFVGHVASLEALTAVAPAAVREDLERVAETFVRARDAGGWDTLLDFAASGTGISRGPRIAVRRRSPSAWPGRAWAVH